MSTTDDLRAIRNMVHNIDVGLAEVMAWLDGVIERTDALTDRRDVLAEITRDETADGPRADGFPANDTTVVRDDGAGKGSTAAGTGARSDAQPAEAPGEGRGEIGPQNGVQSLGGDLRELSTRMGVVRDEFEMRYLAARADALEDERDRLAAEVAIMRDADLTATDVQRRRAEKAEAERDDFREHARNREATAATLMRERDEARAEVELLQRAAQVTDASWREHVERAERAEAAVARVRALLDRPLIPSALLRDALDGVDAGGEGK